MSTSALTLNFDTTVRRGSDALTRSGDSVVSRQEVVQRMRSRRRSVQMTTASAPMDISGANGTEDAKVSTGMLAEEG